VTIATGYVGTETIRGMKDRVAEIAQDGGRFSLVIGMSFFQGLSKHAHKNLESLHEVALQGGNGSGVRFVYTNTYHGKVYRFRSNSESNIYIGSSNLSVAGLSGNTECMAEILDERTASQANGFLDFLCTDAVSKPIDKVDITIRGGGKHKKYTDPRLASSEAMRYDMEHFVKPKTKPIEIKLGGFDKKQKSGLNCYFGKGRLARSTGIVTPRDWFEVEIISSVDTTSDPKYPKGDFLAYTDDGYVIPCRTQGDYYKNLRSIGSLHILGKWIKGKLQKESALNVYEPVTDETLDQYGNDTIKLYPREDGSYYMEFLSGE